MSAKEFSEIPQFASKPHIAILTDICNEPDDAESFCRYLLYSNEFHTDCLVATTSTWQRTSVHKSELFKIIDAFESVLPSLNAHVPLSRQYPTAESLRAVVRDGIPSYGMNGARGSLNEGTKLLIHAVDAIPNGESIWILIWGGASVLAQALLYLRSTRDDAAVNIFVDKLRVYAISDQDDAGPWIRLNFPSMFYIASIHGWNMYGVATWSGISGESYYHFHPGGPDSTLVSKEWIKNHIQIGPYGSKAYPDPVFIPEGDTPTYLSIIQNGLTEPEHPEWGGWGGRYILTDMSGESKHYSDTADTVIGKDGNSHIGSQASIWRWRDAYQGDFAARLQWTLTTDFTKANHAPIVLLNGDASLKPLHLRVSPGTTVELDASQSWDPDAGDSLCFRWIHYKEPSSTQWTVDFQVPTLEFQDCSADSGRPFEKVKVRLPGRDEGAVFPLHPEKVMKWGNKTYHLILEVSDDAKFKMRSYRRILIEVFDELASGEKQQQLGV